MMASTQLTATVTGNTYRFREFLKGEGFQWDGSEWTMSCSETADGSLEGARFMNSTRKHFEDRVSAYTKRQCGLEWS